MGKSFFGRLFGGVPESGLKPEPVIPSAETVEADLQFQQGRRLFDGDGVPASQVQAAECYRKAAGQGHPAAQYNLGMMYGQGQGMPRDEECAGMWLGRAAALGYPAAQYQVGVGHHRTSRRSDAANASESRIEAFKWLKLAVGQGYKAAASAWEFVVLGMTQAEVDEGRRRVSEFVSGVKKPAVSV